MLEALSRALFDGSGSEQNYSYLTGFSCEGCGKSSDYRAPVNTCPNCGSMLSCTYDYEKAKEVLDPSAVSSREKSLWRYHEVLPIRDPRNMVSLGEGLTPIVPLANALLLKDDGAIPTGTFKARGMSVAVSKAKEFGLKKLVVPSAGNAGSALACYAARAGISAKVYMPVETPESMVKECKMYGAEVVQVEGNIGDAGSRMRVEMDDYFDVSTLKEPCRLEGKKTMGYEIAEQTRFELPDVILYPTGGGTGLLGMWKAFDELEKLGWIGGKRPRFFAVQSNSCAPIVEAIASDLDAPDPEFPDGLTVATGLRVPRPFAGREVVSVLKESRGGAVGVPDTEILNSMRALAKQGVLACPEGAATLAGYNKLSEQGGVSRDERALLYNTGTGLKYMSLS